MSAVRDAEIMADSLLTSYQVGTLLQVNPSSVNKWVKDGRLPAFRTPGGHRRIRAADVVNFLRSHKMPVPQILDQAALRRVLLIDGDAEQISHIRQSLKEHASQVDLAVAAQSIQALLELGIHRPHVILISIQSGPLDCLELTRQLRAHADTKQISIFLLGRAPDAQFEQRALAAGAQAVLPYGVAHQQLWTALGLKAAI